MARPVTEGTRELVKALYLAGKPMSHIVTETGVRSDTVRQWSSRGKWPALRLAVTVAVKDVMTQKVTDALANQGDKARAALATEIEAAANAFAKAPCVTVDELLNNEGRTSRIAGVKTLVDAASVVFGWNKGDNTNGLVGYARVSESFIDVSSVESTEPAQVEPSPCMDVKLTSIDDSPKTVNDNTLEK